MVTVVVHQDDFSDQVLGTAIQDTDNGAEQSWPCLVVESNDYTRLGQVLAVFLVPAPWWSNTHLQVNNKLIRISLSLTLDSWCRESHDYWAGSRWPPGWSGFLCRDPPHFAGHLLVCSRPHQSIRFQCLAHWGRREVDLQDHQYHHWHPAVQ